MTAPFKIVVLIDTSRASGRETLKGVSAFGQSNGHWEICLMPLLYNAPTESSHMLQWLKAQNADGIIARDFQQTEALQSFNIPIIQCSSSSHLPAATYTIATDDPQIATLAFNYLSALGHSQFAYCGFSHLSWSTQRGTYFHDLVIKNNQQIHLYKTVQKKQPQPWHLEKPQLISWLKDLPKPIALLACNDDRGIQIIEACKEANIIIPDEIAILGCDNDNLVCNLTTPPLSSMQVNFHRGGFEGAQLLDDILNKRPLKHTKILAQGTEVVSRTSTNIFAINDTDLQQAVTYIRSHYLEQLDVDQVVNQTALSRRVLENRFRKYLNRSIYQEIQRVQIQHIADKLVHTNLSVAQIALSLNFTSSEHISRLFKKIKGLSPLAYRKANSPQ